MGDLPTAGAIPSVKLLMERVSTALEKIDTPNLNSIGHRVYRRIDFTIGALTNHVRTVVESEREFPASSDRRKFPHILELIEAKTQLCAARASYPTPEYRSRAQALQREVKARVREFEMRVGATSWKSNHPTKRFGQLPKRSKPRIYPIPHSKT
ncbi:hypothetical protein EVAR_90109_1 [Eumeta japonica]|uniref:Uncharacterized protein n=1 Tax=Eumeta variegata TaxID=151549 RepID=A0A4C1WY97_EUMVA|nr:hypothetical protein EVAR_90109_1 [Eumeta japonica]